MILVEKWTFLSFFLKKIWSIQKKSLTLHNNFNHNYNKSDAKVVKICLIYKHLSKKIWKMTSIYQNLADWIKSSGRTKASLFREFRQRGGVISITRFQQWTMLDADTKDEKCLTILSEMTGLPKEDLFRMHEVWK